VNEPIRLFLVSPALAIRHALARSLDAEAEILVIGEADSAVDAVARTPAARPHLVLTGAHLRDPDTPELCRRPHEAMPASHIIAVGVTPAVSWSPK
jgi:two-component system, NarL family, response regulator DevR